jgi:signal transduction histidine kinase
MAGIGGFAVVASLALLAVLQQLAIQQEEDTFSALTQSNVAFLKTSTLPRSPAMEQRLGAVMDAVVQFGKEKATAPRLERLGGLISIVYELDAETSVRFSRESAGRWAFLQHKRTWWALGTLWLASVGLGGWFARGLVRPLRRLTEALPGMTEERPLPTLPVERTDEIGALARALVAAHGTLLDERDRRRAAERLAMLGQMAASLAHEVRNPVSAIRLHAQLLEGAPAAEAEASRTLIAAEAERIESLVKQWMHFAKPAPPQMLPHALMPLVNAAVQSVSAQAQHAGVKLEVEGEELSVSVDQERITQVLVNVLLNGIQAQPEGGRIQITIQPSADANVEVRVDDDGAGFSSGALRRAGEAFFSEKEGGMGLGLASAIEVARAHGGVLLVGNRQPRGGRVTLQLPIANPA